MRTSLLLLATLFTTNACTDEQLTSDGSLLADESEPGEMCTDDEFSSEVAPIERIAAPDEGAGTCICEQCGACDYNFKLCMKDNTFKDCDPGIPGGTPPDWRWLVDPGSYGSCAALDGVTMSGHWYYGGNKKCKLKNCSSY
jgi:hypothetical protein